MPRIHKLSAHEARKIAAGEVVERPANVVKELIENALDAGATSVTLYLEEAGKKLIRVVDNGSGMDKEDAYLCFEHHATSKITSVNDLESINTFGFRGEALSSISAVSRVTLITKTESSAHGIKLELEHGAVCNEQEVSHTTGTDIQVRDLFYNIPARQKFLKKNETEWNHIEQLFFALAVDYRNVHFKLFTDGKQQYNCPPVSTLMDRLAQLWDRTLMSNSLEIANAPEHLIQISGVITNHQYFRYNRNEIMFFVNSRWVKNHHLVSALLKGYLNVLPAGRYPAACIFITLDPHQIDVNVHPRKEEVQFLHPRIVESLLNATVKSALEAHLSHSIKREVTFAQPIERTPWRPQHSSFELPAFNPFAFEIAPKHSLAPTEITYTKAPQETNDFAAAFEQPFDDVVEEKIAPDFFDEPVAQAPTQQSIATNDDTAIDTPKPYTIIGQLHKTYILLETDEGLFVIDQHAAHERILYELFSERFKDVAVVNLLFPNLITLSAHDIALITPHLDVLADNGIVMDIFGADQVTITATPIHLKDQSLKDLIGHVVGWIEELSNVPQAELKKELNNKLQAQMACKAAIKAGDVLNQQQMQQLIDDLYKTNNRFICAHGRPTGWLVSQYEIEKKFKRKL